MPYNLHAVMFYTLKYENEAPYNHAKYEILQFIWRLFIGRASKQQMSDR